MGRGAPSPARLWPYLLAGATEVLRKRQFLIKTRGHDDQFFQRMRTIKRRQRRHRGPGRRPLSSGLRAPPLPPLGAACPPPPPPQMMRAVDNSSVNMPERDF